MAKTASDQLIFNKYFKFEVKGIYGEVPGCTRVSGGELTITVEEDEREEGSSPIDGKPKYGDLTFSVQAGPGLDELEAWARKALIQDGRPDGLRRDCALHLLTKDKTTVLRTIDYFGCYPIGLDRDEQDLGSEVKSITFTCDVDRVEMR